MMPTLRKIKQDEDNSIEANERNNEEVASKASTQNTVTGSKICNYVGGSSTVTYNI